MKEENIETGARVKKEIFAVSDIDLKQESRKIIIAFHLSRGQKRQVGWLPYPMISMKEPTCK